MKLNNEILVNREFISLAKVAGVIDNTATTKIQAVKPNRHTLAIFTPRHSTGVNLSSLQDTFTVSSVYGGLIGVNTKPKGNSPSRICAVVETRHPINGVVSLTKHIGASIMTAQNSTQAPQSHAKTNLTPFDLLNTKDVLQGMITAFDDVQDLMHLIQYGNLSPRMIKSIARAAQSHVNAWAEVGNDELETLKGMTARGVR